jgi:hypothetical protein
MAEAVDGAQPGDGTNQLSVRACAIIASMKTSADCEVRVGGTVFPQVHKVVLAVESAVLRQGMIAGGMLCRLKS